MYIPRGPSSAGGCMLTTGLHAKLHTSPYYLCSKPHYHPTTNSSHYQSTTLVTATLYISTSNYTTQQLHPHHLVFFRSFRSSPTRNYAFSPSVAYSSLTQPLPVSVPYRTVTSGLWGRFCRFPPVIVQAGQVLGWVIPAYGIFGLSFLVSVSLSLSAWRLFLFLFLYSLSLSFSLSTFLPLFLSFLFSPRFHLISISSCLLSHREVEYYPLLL